MSLGFINSWGSREMTEGFAQRNAYLVSGPELEWVDVSDDDDKTEFLFQPNKDLSANLTWSEGRDVWDFEIRAFKSEWGSMGSVTVIWEEDVIERPKSAWKKALEDASLLFLKFAIKGDPIDIFGDLVSERKQTVKGPMDDPYAGTDF